MLKLKRTVLSFIFAIFFLGCANQDIFNQSAPYWYNKILEASSNGLIDKADEYYISLQSEHTASILLPQATLMLADVYINEEEDAIISRHYLEDEYIKRYAKSEAQKEWAQFMIIKAYFKSLTLPNRRQKFRQTALEEIEQFETAYPSSIFKSAIQTMKIKIEASLCYFNLEVAGLYGRIGAPKAKELYTKKANDIKDKFSGYALQEPNIGWLRKLIE